MKLKQTLLAVGLAVVASSVLALDSPKMQTKASSEKIEKFRAERVFNLDLNGDGQEDLFFFDRPNQAFTVCFSGDASHCGQFATTATDVVPLPATATGRAALLAIDVSGEAKTCTLASPENLECTATPLDKVGQLTRVSMAALDTLLVIEGETANVSEAMTCGVIDHKIKRCTGARPFASFPQTGFLGHFSGTEQLEVLRLDRQMPALCAINQPEQTCRLVTGLPDLALVQKISVGKFLKDGRYGLAVAFENHWSACALETTPQGIFSEHCESSALADELDQVTPTIIGNLGGIVMVATVGSLVMGAVGGVVRAAAMAGIAASGTSSARGWASDTCRGAIGQIRQRCRTAC